MYSHVVDISLIFLLELLFISLVGDCEKASAAYRLS